MEYKDNKDPFSIINYRDYQIKNRNTILLINNLEIKLGDVEISPKLLVRWLGVFLDPKLIFKQYVEIRISKVKAAFYLIRRLSNI